MKTVMRFLPKKQKKEWEKGLEGITPEKYSELAESNGQKVDSCDKMLIYCQDAEKFEDYMLECGKSISKRLRNIAGVELFRQSVKDILNSQSQEDLLLRILAGGMNEIIKGMGGIRNADS